jgi:hypothetical protein
MSWEIHGRVDDPKNTLDTVYYRSEFAKYAFWEENIRNYSVEIGQ